MAPAWEETCAVGFVDCAAEYFVGWEHWAVDQVGQGQPRACSVMLRVVVESVAVSDGDHGVRLQVHKQEEVDLVQLEEDVDHN